MERKHCFMIVRGKRRLPIYFKCCSLITSSDNCPMPLSCSWRVFSWAWVIPGISGSVLFSWVCLNVWFLCCCLSINMSLSAPHLRSSSQSQVQQWRPVLFLSNVRNRYHFCFHLIRCEAEERCFWSIFLLYSHLWGGQITWLDNFTDDKMRFWGGNMTYPRSLSWWAIQGRPES